MKLKKKNSTSIKKTSAPWSCYWAKQSDESNGCLPEAPVAVSQILERRWHSFFDSLGQGTKVLDLGTGRGTVLNQARMFRPDLQLTGVDYAEGLTPCGNDIKIVTNIKMEELPYGDNSFGAVCSQFGVEYAAFPAGIKEMKRVLVNNGQFMLICHCAESIIVQQNVSRMAVLRSVISFHGLMAEALKLKKNGKINKDFGRQRLTHKLGALHTLYPDQNNLIDKVASDIVEVMGRKDGLRQLMDLQRDIEMEVLRIRALIEAAWDDEQAQTAAQLLSSGCENRLQSVKILLPGTDRPLAWAISSIC